MMKFFYLLFLPVFLFAQNKEEAKLSEIKMTKNKMNTVYRGYQNPFSITVNNAKSYKVTGKNVEKNEEGQYVINPRLGTETQTKVLVEIIKNNGKKIIEEHIFEVKPFPHLFYSINNSLCSTCEFSKEALKKAYIGIRMDDPNFDFSFETQSFNCKVPGFPTITCEGKHFNKRALDCIMKANRGDLIIISEVKGIKKGFEFEGCIKFSGLAIKIF